MGTVNKSTTETEYGSAIHSTHGLDFPHFECVRSTTKPIMISEHPSKSLETSITTPMAATETPT